MSRTVIIGGGISGLATAFYLNEYSRGAMECVVLESSSRWGGKIASAHEDGFLVEGGPDSFLAQKRATLEFCRSLGLQSHIVPSNTGTGPSTYVWSGGSLKPMPEGMMLMAPTMFLPMLRSNLISWVGKLRMAMEVLIPANQSDDDESLGSFVRRRLGQEVLDKIAGPLMAGIYSADPDRLSLRSTFPMFVEMERTHGSLVLGMMRRKKPHQGTAKPGQAPAKPQPMFVSLSGGVQELTDALVKHFKPECMKLSCRVNTVTRENGKYLLELSDGSTMSADYVVFTTPAFVTADIMDELDPVLAAKLRGIHYVSTATVSLGFKRSDIKSPLNGFGFIVPATEGRRINACSWSSSKFDNRAPDDSVLMRVFVGGAMAEQNAEQDEQSLIELARKELRIILGITAEPVLAKAYRWRKASPQYEVGHHARVEEIESRAATHPGIYLAGSGFYGAGIPDCVLRGTDTALKIVKAEARANCNCNDTTNTASAEEIANVIA